MMKTQTRGSGFTLIELLIVMITIEILAVPLIGFFVFPFRVHATLSEANDTTAACGRMLNHLADDVRCADSISIVKEVGDRDELSALDNLSIQRADKQSYTGKPWTTESSERSKGRSHSGTHSKVVTPIFQSIPPAVTKRSVSR